MTAATDPAETPKPTASESPWARTLRLRIKDKHAKFLGALAHDVNQVWNFCNDLSTKVFERERRFKRLGMRERHCSACGAILALQHEEMSMDNKNGDNGILLPSPWRLDAFPL